MVNFCAVLGLVGLDTNNFLFLFKMEELIKDKNAIDRQDSPEYKNIKKEFIKCLHTYESSISVIFISLGVTFLVVGFFILIRLRFYFREFYNKNYLMILVASLALYLSCLSRAILDWLNKY